MSHLWLLNAVAYSLQLVALVAAALVAVRLWPIHDAGWRFRFWRAAFLVAATLPLLALWGGGESGTLANGIRLVAGVDEGGRMSAIDGAWPRRLVTVLVAGAVVRLAWLLLGYLAIRRYIARATPVSDRWESLPREMAGSWHAEVRVSTDLRSPATVGWRRPVILVPPELFDLPEAASRAVLAHELAHVRRGDWLRMVGEEAWCAVLWFHPLARALVSRLDVAREMLVDRDVLTAGADRRAYAEALLAFAAAPAGMADPAARFIRPRHLAQRIEALTTEVPMSGRRTFVSVVAVAVVVFVTTAAAVVAVPLPGAALPTSAAARVGGQDDEVAEIGDGVTAPIVVHKVRAEYTKAAMEAKIQGAMLLSVVVRADGTVGRVLVVRSLDTEYGLDAAAVGAMRQWRFVAAERDGRPVAVKIDVEMVFTLRG